MPSIVASGVHAGADGVPGTPCASGAAATVKHRPPPEASSTFCTKCEVPEVGGSA